MAPGCYCQWCGYRSVRRTMYKLRDGPIDWWFCNCDHALDFVYYRHSTPSVHRMLKLTPADRAHVLAGMTVEQWVSKEVSQHKENNATWVAEKAHCSQGT